MACSPEKEVRNHGISFYTTAYGVTTKWKEKSPYNKHINSMYMYNITIFIIKSKLIVDDRKLFIDHPKKVSERLKD